MPGSSTLRKICVRCCPGKMLRRLLSKLCASACKAFAFICLAHSAQFQESNLPALVCSHCCCLLFGVSLNAAGLCNFAFATGHHAMGLCMPASQGSSCPDTAAALQHRLNSAVHDIAVALQHRLKSAVHGTYAQDTASASLCNLFLD